MGMLMTKEERKALLFCILLPHSFASRRNKAKAVYAAETADQRRGGGDKKQSASAPPLKVTTSLEVDRRGEK